MQLPNNNLGYHEVGWGTKRKLYIAEDANQVGEKGKTVKKNASIVSYPWAIAKILSGLGIVKVEKIVNQKNVYYVNAKSYQSWTEKTKDLEKKTLDNIASVDLSSVKEKPQHTISKFEPKQLAEPPIPKPMSELKSAELPTNISTSEPVKEKPTAPHITPPETMLSAQQVLRNKLDPEINKLDKQIKDLKESHQKLKERVELLKKEEQELKDNFNVIKAKSPEAYKWAKAVLDEYFRLMNEGYSSIQIMDHPDYQQKRKEFKENATELFNATEAKEDKQREVTRSIVEAGKMESQIKELEAKKMGYEDQVNHLIQVQEFALQDLGKELSTHPNAYITSIKNYFQGKPLEKLQEFYRDDVLTDIFNFRDYVRAEYPEIFRLQGVDAANRWLITAHHEFRASLEQPEKILALFALQEAAKIEPKFNNAISVFKTPGQEVITLTGMIEYGFKPELSYMTLTALPPSAEEEKYLPLESYVTRRENFLKEIATLEKSVTKLGVEVSKTPLTNIYSTSDGKSYRERFETLCTKISGHAERGKRDQLIENKGNWIFFDVKYKQFEPDFFKLIEKCGFEIKSGLKVNKNRVSPDTPVEIDGSIDMVAQKIANSLLLLDPKISHSFDRLHLIAALIDDKKYIKLNDGLYSNREIISRVLQELEKGVTPENAIAAEQLFIRIKILEDWMSSWEKENK